MWCTCSRADASSKPAARNWRSNWKRAVTRSIAMRPPEIAMKPETRPIKTAAETALADNFRRVRGTLPGSEAVAALREAAFRRFEAEGLPSRRLEDWKYTDLRALMREAKPLAGVPGAAARARAKR